MVASNLFEVKLIALHESLDTRGARVLHEIPVDVDKQGRMDVGAPRSEPVRREWQHSFGWRSALELFVYLQQAFAG